MPQRPQVGIGVIITKDDQVLLIKSSNVYKDETWSTPGGHLEYGEHSEQSAIRIAKEQLGVIITDITFLAITNDIFEAPEMHFVTIWMVGRYVSGTPGIHATHEMSALDWFSWDALPDPLFLPFEHLLTGCCYPALWDFSGGAKS
jgi:8-oxo-dGTP diphosphatase